MPETPTKIAILTILNISKEDDDSQMLYLGEKKALRLFEAAADQNHGL